VIIERLLIKKENIIIFIKIGLTPIIILILTLIITLIITLIAVSLTAL
jgi:hypothetical protein